MESPFRDLEEKVRDLEAQRDALARRLSETRSALDAFVLSNDRARTVAVRYGGIDGEHHKAWAIDQMVRALTGCPWDSVNAFASGESNAYRALVADARNGQDGPETYDWDVGVAP